MNFNQLIALYMLTLGNRIKPRPFGQEVYFVETKFLAMYYVVQQLRNGLRELIRNLGFRTSD